jgi:hypothetical protein
MRFPPPEMQMISVYKIPANLLVVNLRVLLYKLVHDGSRRIFSWIGEENSQSAAKEGIQPGGHDFLWLFSTPLATDRGWSPDYGDHVVEDS